MAGLGTPAAPPCKLHHGHGSDIPPMGWVGDGLCASGSALSLTLTQTMPLALHTCIHWACPDAFTTACATVGANTLSTMTNRAKAAVKRR